MMKIIPFTQPNIKLISVPNQYPKQLDSQVCRIWHNAKQTLGDSLFNSMKLQVYSITQNELIVKPVEYKYFYAQRQDPELKNKLNIQLLAVSGLLECPEGIIVGCRQNTLQANNHWELVPSGSIDFEDSNPEKQIIDELNEEVGITYNDLNKLTPTLLIIDHAEGVTDIVYKLHTPLHFHSIQQRFCDIEHKEYSQLNVIKPSEVRKFINENTVVHTSSTILEHATSSAL